MRTRYWLLLVLILVLPTLVWISWNTLASTGSGSWSYSQLLQQAGQHRVARVELSGSSARATDVQGRAWTVPMPPDSGPAVRTLIADGVDVTVRSDSPPGGSLLLLSAVTGLVLLAGLGGFAAGRASGRRP